MPLISATVIQKARMLRRCDACGTFMQPGTPQVRCYGYAEVGDTPYNVWLCQQCHAAQGQQKESADAAV